MLTDQQRETLATFVRQYVRANNARPQIRHLKQRLQRMDVDGTVVKSDSSGYQLLYTGANFSGFLFQTGEGKRR